MDRNVIEMNIIISGLTSDQNIGDIRFEVSSEDRKSVGSNLDP